MDSYLDTYDSKTASRIVGVSLRQLQYWDEQDFIRPSVSWPEGAAPSGSIRFTISFVSKVVKDLARHGFSLQKIRRCLRPLKDKSSQTARPAGVA